MVQNLLETKQKATLYTRNGIERSGSLLDNYVEDSISLILSIKCVAFRVQTVRWDALGVREVIVC